MSIVQHGKNYKFVDILNNKSVIKIEVVLYFNGQFIPFSNVFEFKIHNKGVNQDKTTIDSIPSLAREVKKYHESNPPNYLKVLKRLFIISLQTKATKLSEKLINIFNSELGKIYKVKSGLEVVKDVLEKYKDAETIKRVKNYVEMLKEQLSSQSQIKFNKKVFNNFNEINKTSSSEVIIKTIESIVNVIQKLTNNVLFFIRIICFFVYLFIILFK